MPNKLEICLSDFIETSQVFYINCEESENLFIKPVGDWILQLIWHLKYRAALYQRTLIEKESQEQVFRFIICDNRCHQNSEHL